MSLDLGTEVTDGCILMERGFDLTPRAAVCIRSRGPFMNVRLQASFLIFILQFFGGSCLADPEVTQWNSEHLRRESGLKFGCNGFADYAKSPEEELSVRSAALVLMRLVLITKGTTLEDSGAASDAVHLFICPSITIIQSVHYPHMADGTGHKIIIGNWQFRSFLENASNADKDRQIEIGDLPAFLYCREGRCEN